MEYQEVENSQVNLNRLSDEAVIYLFSEQLPDLLDRRPELESRIYHAFWKTFARREEIAAIMEELSQFRAETKASFGQVDQRFGQVDQRFEQVDQRFEQVDRRFEQADRRFEAFQAETRANFDRMDQRFGQMDQRFDQTDQRFDQTDQRFDQTDQRIDSLETRVDSLEARMEAGFLDLHKAIDRLGARWGIRNESIFRQTIATLLEQSFGAQVQERHIEGEQFDCIILDGQHILVEIAAHAKRDIQKRMERKRELYTQATGVTPARVILAVGSIHSRQAEALRKAGFEVIEPEEDN
jgi:hypothetical protein